MSVPFETEFPKQAEFLMSIYSKEPMFVCPKGHRHWLPYFLHCGKDYCQHISLKHCKL